MPRPKGAGKADPRLGRISSRIIDDIAREYDNGQKDRLFRRIRNMQKRAYKLAMAEGGCVSFGPDGEELAPAPLVLSQVMNQIALSEEIISKIRGKDQETEAKVTALYAALHGEDSEDILGPTRVIVKYANGVEPTDGNQTEPAAEPGPSSAPAGQ
jgi:hypothetical protein